MSARVGSALLLCAAIAAGAIFLLLASWSPGASEDRFRREHHRGGDDGGGAGVGIGIELGTQLLQRRAKKPGAPGTSTVKSPPAKKGEPEKKKEKPKGPPPPQKPKAEETDCVIYMQYPEKEAPEGAVAGNEDIKNSAKALQKKLAEDAKKKEEDIPLVEVNSTTTLEQALAKISAKGKCCKTLHIVSHGTQEGALDLPYDLPDKNGELTKTDKEAGTQHHLGGPTGKTGWGADRLAEFVKALKKNCKTGTVVFDGCWAGTEGGIAEQVAKEGIPTKGFPGYCEMGPIVDEKTGKKEYSPPRPGKDEHKSDPLKSFDPPKTPDKPKPEEKPKKK
jgi:hypothetical protein